MSVSVDNVLGWGECRSAPTPGGCPSALRAISTIIAANATDRAFLEVHPSDLASLVPTLPGWDQVWFRELCAGRTLGCLATPHPLLRASQSRMRAALATLIPRSMGPPSIARGRLSGSRTFGPRRTGLRRSGATYASASLPAPPLHSQTCDLTLLQRRPASRWCQGPDSDGQGRTVCCKAGEAPVQILLKHSLTLPTHATLGHAAGGPLS